MNQSSATAIVILAAGQGTRMKSRLPKVMHRLAGRPMVRHAQAVGETVKPALSVVVIAPGMEDVARAVAPAQTVVQSPALGTGHAVAQARPLLEEFEGTVLVLYGDTPLIRPETIQRMVAARQGEGNPAVVVLGFQAADPGVYGRLVLGVDGGLDRIVEFKEATPEERAITLCNSGVMAIDGRHLFSLLDAVGNANAKGEYYLTDIVAIARERGLKTAVVEGEEQEVLGVNSRLELAGAEAILQDRLRRHWMAEGVTMQDPASVYLSHDTVLGRDVILEPHVWFGPGVAVGEGAVIHAFSHIEGASVAAGAEVGPYARLRPGAELEAGAKVGNFVEVKNAILGAGAKVNHLSYVGDAWVGPKANIGAGTITCNYDGYNKHLTVIGAGAFIGSNSTLVPPLTIGAGAFTGAGSVITRSVEDDALGITRAEQKTVKGAARKLRERNAAAKAAGTYPKPDPRAGGRAQSNNPKGGK